MQCNDCGREIPDWAGEHIESQGKQTFYLRRTAKTEPVTGVELAKELKRFS